MERKFIITINKPTPLAVYDVANAIVERDNDMEGDIDEFNVEVELVDIFTQEDVWPDHVKEMAYVVRDDNST